MPGEVIRPRWSRAAIDREHADRVRRALTDLFGDMPGAPGELLAMLLLLLDQRTVPLKRAKRGRFAIVCTRHNEAVVRWALENAKRPHVSVKLWMSFQNHLRTDTNEIMMTRAHMMDVAGATSPDVSVALSEFCGIRALQRVRNGREVRWRVTTLAATHLGGAARDEAQDAEPALLAAIRQAPQQP